MNQRRQQATESSSWAPKLAYAGGILILGALFVGAVVSAGISVRASYDLAQLQQRRQAAWKERQELQEALAAANSMDVVLAYAEENEMVRNTSTVAFLELTTPLAQR